ncbi:MAG: beta-phosphoglucomutase [Bacteroidota bacterium]|nr:beta-phosphoglucomutase [Bacteroidota bacterium]MDX5468261.1 beta-phosphoglucomutase [Bacteroidota bacterium]
MPEIRACLFDLDGVLVDTAKYHYIAWKETADSLGIPFDEHDNELLKGVSRKGSLEFILNKGRQSKSENEIEHLLESKNSLYLKLVSDMTPEEVLPGVRRFLEELKAQGIKIALGSASKNAQLILDKCELSGLFDAIVDGRHCTHSKPHPEVFEKGMKALGSYPTETVVFEDAISGIIAGNRAGCFTIGVGEKDVLKEADAVIEGFKDYTPKHLFSLLSSASKSKIIA